MTYHQVGILFGALVTLTGVMYALYRLSVSDKNRGPTTINLDVVKQPRSWAAGQLRQEFHQLPANHRPSVDIDAIVKALDTKYSIEDVNHHFKRWQSDGNGTLRPDWQHNCRQEPCPYRDYTGLHDQMEALLKAHDAREHALAIAEQQHGFEQMQEMLSQLASEANFLNDSAANIEKGSPDVRDQ